MAVIVYSFFFGKPLTSLSSVKAFQSKFDGIFLSGEYSQLHGMLNVTYMMGTIIFI
jgi:hypothetical protein